ncbi:hypothetical protein D3C86_731360 [compost metagenome]
MILGEEGTTEMNIIHTLPMFINSDPAEIDGDLLLVQRCFQSLGRSQHNKVVIYNQGSQSNELIEELSAAHGVSSIVLGSGVNIGIAQARQACFQYIWDNYEDTPYITEIHLDMVFPPNWAVPLVEFLEQSDEPLVSPAILTRFGEMQPLGTYVQVPENIDDLRNLLLSFERDEVMERFVHPVVHKSQVLKEIGGYDTRFIQGKQGYEDDSILLGYFYYMGTRTKWRPKSYLRSWVYHETMAQRMSLPGRHHDFQLNEEGLFNQYGAYGLKHLAGIHHNSAGFEGLFQSRLETLKKEK